MADEKPKEEAKNPEAEAAAGGGGGGMKAMLPLIITIVMMPVLAFVMTQFVIVPKLQKAITASASTGEHGEGEGEGEVAAEGGHGEEASSGGHGDSSGEEGEHKPIPPGAKATYELTKVIVNVAKTQATRYLMSSYTLVGKGEEFRTLLNANEDQVRDVAAGVLSVKTIQDLEKPDARSLIKSELTSAINTALGKPAVLEVYVTEFAIQ